MFSRRLLPHSKTSSDDISCTSYERLRQDRRPGGAAERLGMNRTTLNSRMQKLRISRKDF